MPESIKVMQNELVCRICKIKGRFRDCTICTPAFEDSEIIAVYEVAIEALKSKSEAEEYRTPKKPIYGSMAGCKCPTCGENICSADADHLCPYCGQALDWSEVKG